MFTFLNWFFLAYFLSINLVYLLLNLSSILSVRRYIQHRQFWRLGGEYSELMPSISVIVPVFNEEENVVQTVKSLLSLEYPSLEIIIVNDGSMDSTLDQLKNTFELNKMQAVNPGPIQTKPIRNLFHSKKHDNLRIIDKENGGKADALNCGINLASTPLVSCIDGDSILERSSLKSLVRPFLVDSKTIAVGGTVRVANGCKIRDGFIEEARLASRFLPFVQTVEYLRAFLFGRLGWEPLNSLMIISGAFGLFQREALLKVGGYHTDTVTEDMELIVRMHKVLLERREDYRIHFLPDPICWTEVPQDISSLRNQRIRWQRGLAQTVLKHFNLFFKSASGAVGWIAYPYLVLFEWMGPFVELFGYGYVALGISLGYVSYPMAGAFFVVSIAFGMLVSVLAILLEVISFHVYENPKDLMWLFIAAILENLGLRQVMTLWRFHGNLQMFQGGTGDWGEIKRSGFSTSK